MSKTSYPIQLSKAALAAVEPCMGANEVRRDVNSLRRGGTTAEELLQLCLSGIEEGEPSYDELAEGWRDYVAAVVTAATRRVVGVRFIEEFETEGSDLWVYGSFLVTFRDADGFEVERPCGAEVGVPGYLRGTAEACGSAARLLSAEWGDSSDWAELPDEWAAEAALEAIAAQAGRLLREAIQARPAKAG